MEVKLALFAYGTLEIPEVMMAVTGRSFSQQPALIVDHARYRLKNRAYPGLREEYGVVTNGTVYTGLDAEAMQRLDTFETDLYVRKTLTVHPEAGGLMRAEVYLIRPVHYGQLTGEAWDQAAFVQQSLRRFLHRYSGGGVPGVDLAPSDRD
jgi:gamma-glutamylcyclotransferase (GGCT)/AIG2-like uncharacterized protein YtfP